MKSFIFFAVAMTTMMMTRPSHAFATASPSILPSTLMFAIHMPTCPRDSKHHYRLGRSVSRARLKALGSIDDDDDDDELYVASIAIIDDEDCVQDEQQLINKFSRLRSLGIDYGLSRTGLAITTGGYHPRPLVIVSGCTTALPIGDEEADASDEDDEEDVIGSILDEVSADVDGYESYSVDVADGSINDEDSEDTTTATATATQTTANNSQSNIIQYNNTLLCNTIINYAISEQVTNLVLGLPLHKNGSISEQSLITRQFGYELLQTVRTRMGYNANVTLWDERYTSKEAASRIVGEAIARNRRIPSASDLNGALDDEAACIILEHYYQALGQDAEVLALNIDVERTCLEMYQVHLQEEERRRREMSEERERGVNARRDMIERAKSLERENESGSEGESGGRKKKKKRKKK